MSVFNILSLIGGLAMFLFGMSYMGTSLKKLGGGKFESILEKMTNSRIKGVLLGAVVTLKDVIDNAIRYNKNNGYIKVSVREIKNTKVMI